MNWLTIFLIVLIIAIPLLYWKAKKTGRVMDNTKRFIKTNFLIVTAHPDDEAMFMTPTILNITQNKSNQVFLLWLSTGNADGIGGIRSKELRASWSNLRISQLKIIDDEKNFPDAMNKTWDKCKISETVNTYIKESKIKVDVILTFDEFGVSHHPNHIWLYHGWKLFMKEFGQERGVKIMYALITTSLFRKFIGIFDSIFTYRNKLRKRTLVSYTCASNTRKALRIHWSQYVWFRRLFTIFSRYAYMNEWKI